MQRKTVLVEHYGCTMNAGEARRASRVLEELGYHIADKDHSEPDAVLIFTCDVISATERRMWKRIEEVQGSKSSLYVAGCLAALEGEEIARRFPSAVVLDTMGVQRTELSVREAFPMEWEGPSARPFESVERLDHIVPIASGCYGSCTYCVTRLARGSHISVPPEAVVESVMEGAASGKREILITSQDTAAYGRDLETDLGDLLRKITKEVRAEIRMRVGMMNPDNIIRSLESVLDGYDDGKVFRFFHIPVQSGSARILGMMGRNYSPGDVVDLFRKIRERYPGATLSTDVITGYPSETEEDHLASLELVRELRPDILNITRFSRRRGTLADMMKDQVPGWVTKERSREMTRLHSQIVGSRLEERIGTHGKCLVTEVGRNGTMMARDQNYTPIVVEGESVLMGEFLDIETTDRGPTYLLGQLC